MGLYVYMGWGWMLHCLRLPPAMVDLQYTKTRLGIQVGVHGALRRCGYLAG